MTSHETQSEVSERAASSPAWLAGPTKLLSYLLIFGVRCYQVLLGPILGGHCRFTPSCSHYFIAAVQKHGPLRGASKGVIRICKCHPWHPGGYDPP